MSEPNIRILKEYEDMPYTIIAHTSLMPQFRIFLIGDSLKAILEQMRDGEDLRITVSEKGHVFEIIDTHHRYDPTQRDRSRDSPEKEKEGD